MLMILAEATLTVYSLDYGVEELLVMRRSDIRFSLGSCHL